jgi:Rho-binding antiterminator
MPKLPAAGYNRKVELIIFNLMAKYQPIDCNFYDILESLATRQRYARIQYFTELHEFQTKDAVIKDFFIKEEFEFMSLADGSEIRLDRLVSVDGKFVPGKGFDGISCECD